MSLRIGFIVIQRSPLQGKEFVNIVKEAEEKHDSCLVFFQNILRTCCGHGIKEPVYVNYDPWGRGDRDL